MKRAATVKRPRDTGPGRLTRALLWVRAGGACEVCRRDLTSGYPFSRHHRQPRGAGGTSRADVNDLTNLLLVCGTGTTGCHRTIESARTTAYAQGLLVRMGYQPADVPARIRTDLFDTPVYLTPDGHYSPGAAS